jgi:hypothetical protein
MAGAAQTHKTTRRGIVKSANQAGFLPKDLTPVSRDTPIWKLVSLIMWTGGL